MCIYVCNACMHTRNNVHINDIRPIHTDRPIHWRNLRGTGYEGYRYPTFWTEGYHTPTFQDEKVNNLPAVNRGDLQRLRIIIKLFEAGLHPDPAGELMTLSQTPKSDGRGYLLPLSFSRLRDPRAPRTPSELVRPLFRPKSRRCNYRPTHRYYYYN